MQDTSRLLTSRRWAPPPMHDEPPPGRFDDGETLDNIQGFQPQLRSDEPPPPTGKHFEIIPFDQVKLSTEPNYAVKGLLPRRGLAVVWGPPKCGKSFFVSDLMLHVALGWSYRGHRVRQGSVVYCCLEGADGFRARLEAFRQHKMTKPAAVPFYLCPTPLSLVADHPAFEAAVRQTLGQVVPAAVVIDTVNRSLAGSESDDRDMSAYIKAADALRDAFGCLVLLVHHCGIDASRPRGHTSLAGAVDAQIAVKKDANNSILAEVQFMKDGPEGEHIVSKLASVQVGTDTDGDPITSCVIEAVNGERQPKPDKTVKLTNSEKLGLDALLFASLGKGQPLPAAMGIPGNPKAVSVQQWRDELHARGIVDIKSHRMEYKRVHDGLCAKGKAAEQDGLIWPL